MKITRTKKELSIFNSLASREYHTREVYDNNKLKIDILDGSDNVIFGIDLILEESTEKNRIAEMKNALEIFKERAKENPVLMMAYLKEKERYKMMLKIRKYLRNLEKTLQKKIP
jgi:hypothetical protein